MNNKYDRKTCTISSISESLSQPWVLLSKHLVFVSLNLPLQIPPDLNDCSPEERQKRLLRRAPQSRLTLQEQIEDTFDQEAYSFLLKKN
ncbi:uncharacterized protein DC041_0010837 [Schistosoma bovis]|uniref:Uncharacterized protein n=1 Tax=Schistosoma bovis TaxID=6184 RepID=A0A430QSB4_SCHBO|nr:uncharacterized protein DC041_0010837 [Schistosoma bovis]